MNIHEAAHILYGSEVVRRESNLSSAFGFGSACTERPGITDLSGNQDSVQGSAPSCDRRASEGQPMGIKSGRVRLQQVTDGLNVSLGGAEQFSVQGSSGGAHAEHNADAVPKVAKGIPPCRLSDPASE